MLNSRYGHNQSKGMGNDPVPESNLVMLTGISTFRFFFPNPIISAAPNSIIYCLRINRLYTMKEKKKIKDTNLIVDFVFALS